MQFVTGNAAVVDGAQPALPALVLPTVGWCLNGLEQTAGPTLEAGVPQPAELERATSACSISTDLDRGYGMGSPEAVSADDRRHSSSGGSMQAVYCFAIPYCWVQAVPFQHNLRPCPNDHVLHAACEGPASSKQMPFQQDLHPCSNDHSLHAACEGPASGKQARCEDEQPHTTLLLRNLPCGYTRDMLLELLDSQAFSGRYNFVYLPMDYNRGNSLGYAFVNMETTQDAGQAWACFDGFREWKAGLHSTKVCNVSWAARHGLNAHIEKFRNSPVMHEQQQDDWKPIVLSQGHRVEFPRPTKTLKPPRMKYRKQKNSSAAEA